MAMLKMKSIRELSEKDLRDRVEQMKTELSKLQTENAKGTLRKETGKIRKVRKEVARLIGRKKIGVFEWKIKIKKLSNFGKHQRIHK